MSLDNTYTVRYRLHLNHAEGDDQMLRIQLVYVSRLISRSPFVGLPYEIIQEVISSTTPTEDALFPLPLRELEDPLLCEAYVVQLLSSSFNLDNKNCNVIARKITSSVVEMAGRNYDASFELVADIDYIQMQWKQEEEERAVRGSCNNVGVMVEEKVVLEEAPLPAAREELGECSVCCDELKGPGKEEVARIPCGHVYHKTCILTWLQMSNSCPLCRAKIRQF